MGQKHASPQEKSSPSGGKIAQRRATEAEQRRKERDERRQAKNSALEAAVAVRLEEAKPLCPPRTAQSEAHQQRKPKAMTQQQRPSLSSDLPPDVAALLIPTPEVLDDGGDDMAAVLAAAMVAAQAALMSDDEMTADDGDEIGEPPAKNNAGDDDISLHSSDYRDEELMGQLGELEEEAEAQWQLKISDLEAKIAHHKRQALDLMKMGGKPAALQELKNAKEFEKQLASLHSAHEN